MLMSINGLVEWCNIEYQLGRSTSGKEPLVIYKSMSKAGPQPNVRCCKESTLKKKPQKYWHKKHIRPVLSPRDAGWLSRLILPNYKPPKLKH